MKYKLYDLEVTTVGDSSLFNCRHVVGEGFIVEGENIRFNKGTTHFSHYALATLLPYLAAKQRAAQQNDWMVFESQIACPDPKCAALFEIRRKRQSTYDYSPIK